MPLSFPNIGNAAEFVGQALGLRRPLRPPGRAFNNLRWGFDRARGPLDPPSPSKSQGFRQPRQADEASAAVQGDRPQLMQVLIPRANLRTQPSPAGRRRVAPSENSAPPAFPESLSAPAPVRPAHPAV